ncbi:hypothetical protein SVIOM342S_07896 [Streptomyces violaceorubidus]
MRVTPRPQGECAVRCLCDRAEDALQRLERGDSRYSRSGDSSTGMAKSLRPLADSAAASAVQEGARR